MNIGRPAKQKGAAAIEFALVFVVFFAVLYGVISYSLPLLVMQGFHQSTAEAVRRSVAVDPTLAPALYKQTVEQRAKDVMVEQLSWLPASLKPPTLKTTAVYDATAGVLTVTVSLPATAIKAIMPMLILPGNITVPNLPTTLTSQSSLHF